MEHCYHLKVLSKNKSNLQQKTQNNLNHLCSLVKGCHWTKTNLKSVAASGVGLDFGSEVCVHFKILFVETLLSSYHQIKHSEESSVCIHKTHLIDFIE